MSDRHPYATAPGYLGQVITQFRKSFPISVTIETLKKLGFAPSNESYILNILRYLGLTDQEGNRTEIAQKIFSLHDNAAFAQEFEKQVSTSYNDLFELHGNDAWELDSDGLITFFRSADGTTDRVGKLQASTFRALASFSGHGDIFEKASPKQIPATSKPKIQKSKPAPKAQNAEVITTISEDKEKKRDIGLTVRIEINLPADGTKETYDKIFKSIKENLLDA